MNIVILKGNLTRDPELAYTSGGQPRTKFGIAVNERRTVAGEKLKQAHFFNITCWGRVAETAAEYLSKGSPVLIQGKLQYSAWEKDGQKHSAVSITAYQVEFLGTKKEKQETSDEPPPDGKYEIELDEEVPF